MHRREIIYYVEPLGWARRRMTDMPIMDEDKAQATEVKAVGNHVYFYSDIDMERVLGLNTAVRRMDDSLVHEYVGKTGGAQTPIWLHLHTMGGDVFAALAAYDHLCSMRSPLYTVVEGVCASSGILLLLAGSRRLIAENGFMLIHQLSSTFDGSHQQFKDELRLQEMLMERICTIYCQKTGLDRETVLAMMSHDSWITAQDAVRLGFCTDVYGHTG